MFISLKNTVKLCLMSHFQILRFRSRRLPRQLQLQEKIYENVKHFKRHQFSSILLSYLLIILGPN